MDPTDPLWLTWLLRQPCVHGHNNVHHGLMDLIDIDGHASYYTCCHQCGAGLKQVQVLVQESHNSESNESGQASQREEQNTICSGMGAGALPINIAERWRWQEQRSCSSQTFWKGFATYDQPSLP